MLDKKIVTINRLLKDLKFRRLTKKYRNVEITTQSSIYRVGYELSGFFMNEEELNEDINVLGRKESNYIENLTEEEQEKIFDTYFSFDFPCLILSKEAKIFPKLLEVAERHRKAVLKSEYRTTELIRYLKFYLQKRLAKEMIINDHILLDVFGVGILITGYEDAKLGVTVELLEREHKFISDTRLKIQNIADRFLLGSNTSKLKDDSEHYYLFGKDGNDIDVTTHFGLKSTRKSKKITLLIELEKWDEKKFYDRLGLDEVYEDFLGIKIPKVTLPVRRGRNLAVIIETAAINYRLKRTGVNSAKYFWEESKKLIEKNRKDKARGINVDEKMSLPVRRLKEKFDLKILHGEEFLDERFIKTTGIHRPSLALTGYFEMYNQEGYNGAQLFADTEFTYLESLPEKDRLTNLEKYLDVNFPVIIVSKVEEIPNYFLEAVKKRDIILLQSSIEKPSQIIATFSAYLENCFAPTLTRHGVFVELYGFGVLLIGRSGIGKSETALELIHRGHRLIADDAVKFERGVVGDITGRASRLPYFMEIRGLGIIDIKALYGVGAVRISKRLDMIIELKELKSEDYLTAMSEENKTEDVLGCKITKTELYISSGRNAAAMVEIAVMNLMAKKMGYDSKEIYLKEMAKNNGGKR